ncbi:MAG: hypothetical protein NTV32_07260 [Gammaproteobacteria bacterium]|nr:hypothetical protein [Gammaproteobacteria bacterium]
MNAALFKKMMFVFMLLFLGEACASSGYSLVNKIPPLTADNALNDILISDGGDFMVLVPDNGADAYVYQGGEIMPLDIPGGVNTDVKSVMLLSGSKKLLVQTDKVFYLGMFGQGWQKIPLPNISKNALIASIVASDQKELTILVVTDDGMAYEFPNADFMGSAMSADGSVRLIDGFKVAALYKNGQWSALQDPALPKDISIENVAMSASGDVMVISTENQGNYIYAHNEWKPLNVNGKNNQGLLTSLVMVNNATEIVAAIQYDAYYLYQNGQWSKIQQTINPNINFSSSAISEDGDKIIVASYDMGAFMWQNGKWTKITIDGAVDGDVNYARFAAKGNVFAIAGGTYTAFNIDGKWKYLLAPQDD